MTIKLAMLTTWVTLFFKSRIRKMIGRGISVTFWRQAISDSTYIHGHIVSDLVSATS